MNKKMIALAVAAGFAPMVANAGPTLYGALQAEFASVDNTATSTMQVEDNKRGRLGIKGNEDLGNGLSAIYKFEWQVETTTADIYDGQRESFVGMKGGFGTIKLGANKSAYKYFGGVKYDPLVTTLLEARGNGGMLKAEGGLNKIYGSNGFLANSISYENKFGPAELWITSVQSETDPSADDMVVGLKGKIGKSFEVFVANADEDGVGTNTKFGGQWKAGPHKISLQSETSSPDVGTDTDVMFLGYQFKMGKNVIVAQMGSVDADGTVNDVDYTALALMHKFSKKTMVFAGLRSTDVDGPNDTDVTSVGLRISF